MDTEAINDHWSRVKGKEFISTVEGKFCFIKRVARVIVDGVGNCLNDIFIYLTFITTLQG